MSLWSLINEMAFLLTNKGSTLLNKEIYTRKCLPFLLKLCLFIYIVFCHCKGGEERCNTIISCTCWNAKPKWNNGDRSAIKNSDSKISFFIVRCFISPSVLSMLFWLMRNAVIILLTKAAELCSFLHNNLCSFGRTKVGLQHLKITREPYKLQWHVCLDCSSDNTRTATVTKAKSKFVLRCQKRFSEMPNSYTFYHWCL